MKNTTVKSLTYTALSAVVIIICSWITIPTVVPFTLQTFAVFLVLGLFGGKIGTAAVIIYILIGLIGVPVFSGFTGGPAVLFGATGGYIIGFILTALIYRLMTACLKKKTVTVVAAYSLGLLSCYAFGTAWFVFLYTDADSGINLLSTLSICVFPFIIPDIIKMILAVILTQRVSKYVSIDI